MRKLMMAGAALMLGAAPMAVNAQSAVGGTNSIEDKAPDMVELNAEQQVEYDAWPAEYQTAYVAWPAEYQTTYWTWPADSRTSYWDWPSDYQDYYWTLTPSQQDVYWSLTADQRAKIAAMTPAQQTQAWAGIESQMAGMNNSSANASATTSASGNANVVMQSNEVVQPMASEPRTPNSEYPVCTNGMTDNCINPREAGKNYGNRALDYWPGKPASEM